ncbi:hypothetical protein PF010_g1478 [Phytophthora fragariae]|uniref:Uncharacterized protein n=1 Tax=Phytophthora fragariae TaxID=53985 RepID=A0A6G0M0S2_9STRA|nr:hypothetical protein PF010_g1478 [Phytophthora fragariae]KAE9254466.1 hypothetical protein PF004_g1025 [Phytophthora fragariae]
MHWRRGDTSWSACLTTIIAPTARVLLVVLLGRRVRARFDGTSRTSTIACAGSVTRRSRIRGSPVVAFLKTSLMS